MIHHTNIIKNKALALIIVLGLSASSCHVGVKQDTSYSFNNHITNRTVRVNIEEAKILSKIAVLNQSIIVLSQLPLNDNSSYHLKTLSNKLSKDHTHINDQLNNLAENKLILLPANVDENQLIKLSNEDDKISSEAYVNKIDGLLKNEIKQLQYLSAITNDVDFKVLTVKALVKLNYNLNQLTKIESITI